MNLVPLSEPNTSFWHHALAPDQEGVVGAFQECAKANCGYPATCFQLRKASSFIVPGNKESIYIQLWMVHFTHGEDFSGLCVKLFKLT